MGGEREETLRLVGERWRLARHGGACG